MSITSKNIPSVRRKWLGVGSMNATVAYEWLVAQDDAERKLQEISPFTGNGCRIYFESGVYN